MTILWASPKEFTTAPRRVVVKVDAQQAPYVESKPFHKSQKVEQRFRDGGIQISLKVVINNELERLISVMAVMWRSLRLPPSATGWPRVSHARPAAIARPAESVWLIRSVCSGLSLETKTPENPLQDLPESEVLRPKPIMPCS